jgi:predicted PurR-regulated permease PerM
MNDSNGPAWQRLSHSALLRFLLLLASGWGVVKVIDYFRAVLTLFIAAAMLAVLLDLPVRRLVRLGCGRGLAILLTVLGAIGVASLFVRVLGIQLISQCRFPINMCHQRVVTAASERACGAANPKTVCAPPYLGCC